MKTIIGITLVAAGVVLLVFGYQSKNSLAERLGETVGAAPRDRTVWLLVGGTACAVAGAAALFAKNK